MSRNLVAAIVLVAVILTGCGGNGDDDSLGNAQPWCVFAGDFIDAVEEFSSLHREGGTKSDSREVADSYSDARRTLSEIEFYDDASHLAVQEVYDAGTRLVSVEEFRSPFGPAPDVPIEPGERRIEDIAVPDRYQGRYEESRERMDEAKETIRHICAS